MAFKERGEFNCENLHGVSPDFGTISVEVDSCEMAP
jgi:hypothetical protein